MSTSGIPDEAGGVLFVSFLVLTVALLAGTGTGTAAAQSAPDCSTVTYDGAGTAANPYEVGNVDQLQCIENQGLEASYKVVNNIDASETEEWNDGKGFDPIGEFRGIFDGRGYNIANLTIDRENDFLVGLFDSIEESTITNVSVIDTDINGSELVGGIVGFNFEGTIEGSYVTGSVNGSKTVGGLVGRNRQGVIIESYATASVSGSDAVGGLVGENIGGTVERSYATGSVEGTKRVGGLVGKNEEFDEKHVRRYVGTIDESYATGPVNGTEEVGGLVGSNAGTVTYCNSYWDTQTTGQSASDGGTGLTTAEMTGSAARENMQGFDFTNTWETVSEGYPRLALRNGSSDGSNRADSGDATNCGEDGSGDDSGDEGDESTTGEGLPGFTVVTALLAIVSVAAAFRRRTE